MTHAGTVHLNMYQTSSVTQNCLTHFLTTDTQHDWDITRLLDICLLGQHTTHPLELREHGVHSLSALSPCMLCQLPLQQQAHSCVHLQHK